MMRRRALIAAALLSAVSFGAGADWRVADGKVAHAGAIESSDGQQATLEVRCRPGLDVRVAHPALARLSANAFDPRPGWGSTVDLLMGWGLDLTRDDHRGWRSAWHRCGDRPDCLVARDADVDNLVRSLKSNWSLFVRMEPPGEIPVDLRVSLAGSAQAIESVCPVLNPGERAGRNRAPEHPPYGFASSASKYRMARPGGEDMRAAVAIATQRRSGRSLEGSVPPLQAGKQSGAATPGEQPFAVAVDHGGGFPAAGLRCG